MLYARLDSHHSLEFLELFSTQSHVVVYKISSWFHRISRSFGLYQVKELLHARVTHKRRMLKNY